MSGSTANCQAESFAAKASFQADVQGVLYAGAKPLGISTSLKPCRVAEDEILAGKCDIRLVRK